MIATEREPWLPRYVFWILVIAILEGGVRKWLFDGFLGQVLVIIRDGIAVSIIFNGFRCGMLRREKPEFCFVLWTLAVIGWSAVQMAIQGTPVWVMAIGMRGWIVYAWLSLVLWRGMEPAHVRTVCSRLLYLSPFIAILALIQHKLPIGHFLNRQLDGDETKVFTVARDMVRTTGTFSFTTGYSTYVCFTLACALGLLLDGVKKVGRMPMWFPLLASAVMVLVSGSRSAWALSGLILAFGVFALWRFGRLSLMHMLLLPIAAVMITLLSMSIFSDAIGAMGERLETANKQEDSSERILGTLFGTHDVWAKMDVLGAGIGMGNNAVNVILRHQGFMLAEMEADRLLLEAGALGLAFIIIKLYIAGYGLARSANRSSAQSVLGCCLWVFTAYHLIFAQLTAQLTIHAFGWTALGLAAAMTKAEPINKCRIQGAEGKQL